MTIIAFISGFVVSMALAYLLGSIPTGLFVVRFFTGEDVRDRGSGRTGGTNAGRAAGWPAGLLTGMGDILKGIVAVNIPVLLFPLHPNLALIQTLCGILAVVGHNYSIYINFKGGAGATPNAGAAVGLWPWSAVVLIPLLPFVLLATGYASVATTSGAVITVIIFSVTAALGITPPIYILYSIVTLSLIMIALIPNYKRLADGTERRVGPRAEGSG